jgi:hypothetical protein
MDLAGAVKDILGKPTISAGKQYDHLGEVQTAISGPRISTKELENLPKNKNLPQGLRDTMKAAADLARAQADRAQKTLDFAKEVAREVNP